VWEIAIKAALGRITLPSTVEDYFAEKVREGLQVLPIEWHHAAAVERLPAHHGDRFDRLLIAQAQGEGLRIVTADPVFRRYGVEVVW
jgi:PIN domain nuclease of toxin-antitoxin system